MGFIKNTAITGAGAALGGSAGAFYGMYKDEDIARSSNIGMQAGGLLATAGLLAHRPSRESLARAIPRGYGMIAAGGALGYIGGKAAGAYYGGEGVRDQSKAYLAGSVGGAILGLGLGYGVSKFTKSVKARRNIFNKTVKDFKTSFFTS